MKSFDESYVLEPVRVAIAREKISGRSLGVISEECCGERTETDRLTEGGVARTDMATSSFLRGSGKAVHGEIIGQSRCVREVVGRIEMVAPTDASVLILGETGTGKELIAREVHRRSRRKDGPLVRVNCGSIPKELYESELFGHAKGAFTSAFKHRIGRFEAAAGGTLFLDEIGEIPLELQSKLLGVLEEKCFERVGENCTRRADVRIVTATNRDLQKEVATGRFRGDLYYRLNVLPVKVAPLRERKDDITLLAIHFINKSVKELGCPRPRLARAGMEALRNYDWPGNIRELRNVIERAVIFAQGGALEFDLPASDSSMEVRSFSSAQRDRAGFEYLTEAEMRRRERENISAVLQKTDWKIKGVNGAAELLGLKPTTLISRMEKMGLKRPLTKLDRIPATYESCPCCCSREE